LKPDFAGLKAAGCIQAESDLHEPLFQGLWAATRGNICDGCPKWESQGPQCKAYQQFHTEAIHRNRAQQARVAQAVSPGGKNGEKWAGHSVAMIAAELGISKSEVRRRKTAGTL
jgi:hypothetical protein